MNSPAHLIVGLAAFGRPNDRRVTLSALTGAALPDASLYLMSIWAIYVQGVSPHVVFREYYYSPEWQRVFAIDNSFVLWGIALTFAFWAARPALTALFAAGMIHLLLDFPFHNHDARMHFWPASDWKFISPLSYWDRNFHAGIVGNIEVAGSVALAILVWRRFPGWAARTLVSILLVAELATGGLFRLFF